MAPDQVYKSIELTGTSGESLEAAVQNAVSKASATVRLMRWFRVEEIRGAIEGAAVSQWQVTIKIGFVVED